MMRTLAAAAGLAGMTACGGGGSGPVGLPDAGNSGLPMRPQHLGRPGPSLGPVLSTSDGGQIFGFDIDQNGSTGVLASDTGLRISVQTFDETSGTITRTFAVRHGRGARKGSDYVADGIFAKGVALIDFQKAGIPGKTPAKDNYRIISPVGKQKFTGTWDPTVKLFNVVQYAVNQSTTTSVVYGYQRVGSDAPELIASNIGRNRATKVIELNPQQFYLGTSPQLAQDTVNDLAVIASSPSGGGAGGPPPLISTVNLKTGQLVQFSGTNCPGLAGCGSANGLAYDSATGIACTTTELDGGVEIYNVAQQTGTHHLMPNGGGQSFAGSYVVNDPIHKLFLIAQTFSSTAPSGSSVQVFDESGNLVESINGLDFTNAGFLAIPVRIAINPSKRIAWVNAAKVNQLQQFSY
jgi:hypothetical protein